MKEEIKALFDDRDTQTKSIPWLPVVLALIGLFSFLGLVGTTEMARWMTGGRAYAPHAPSDTIVILVAYIMGIHVTLGWPLTGMAIPQLASRSRWVQLAVPTLLASLPLVSFAYLLGGVKDLLGLHETLLIVVPAALLATHFYLASGNAWLFTLFLSITTFVLFWVANDILSSFPILFAYASKGGELYFWRAVLPVFTTAGVLYATGREENETNELASLRWATLAVGTYSLILFLILPLAAKWTGEGTGFPVLLRDLGVWLFLLVTLFLWKPSRLAYIGLLSVASVQALFVGLWLVWYASHIRLAFAELFRVSYGAAIFALAVAMIVTLTRSNVRAKFLRNH